MIDSFASGQFLGAADEPFGFHYVAVDVRQYANVIAGLEGFSGSIKGSAIDGHESKSVLR